MWRQTVTIDAQTGTAEFGAAESGFSAAYEFDGDRREGEGPYREALASSNRVEVHARPWHTVASAGHRHLERLRSSARYFGFAFDEGAVRDALDRAGADADRSVKIRLRLNRAGGIEVSSVALDRGAPEPIRLAIDDADRPSDVFLPQDDDASPLRGRAQRHPVADDGSPSIPVERLLRYRPRTSRAARRRVDAAVGSGLSPDRARRAPDDGDRRAGHRRG
jgi:para-aminobenzoate synthetase/4-amino-4-deoxychorismate lyase